MARRPASLGRRVQTAFEASMTRDDRWQHLVNVSFSLSEQITASRKAEGPRLAEARALLDEVLEVFPDSIDPVEDFEGYAIRRMALALRDSLA